MRVFAIFALFEPHPDLRIPEEEPAAKRFMNPTFQLLQRLTRLLRHSCNRLQPDLLPTLHEKWTLPVLYPPSKFKNPEKVA